MNIRKLLLLLSVNIIFCELVSAQLADTTTRHLTKDFYMKRRATRNTIGWVLLGSGVTMAAVSYLTYAGNGFNGTWKLEPLFNAGCVSVIASVPFFIMARQNKIKARFAVNLQKTPLETAFLKTYYPSLSLRIER